jgi:hypothetical protein
MIEWKSNTQLYSSGGKDAFLGKWKVASVGWDGANKTKEKWIIYFYLPGLKSQLKQQYKLIEDAQKRAELAIELWIRESEIGRNGG